LQRTGQSIGPTSAKILSRQFSAVLQANKKRAIHFYKLVNVP